MATLGDLSSIEISLIVATSGRPRLLAAFLGSLEKHGWLERCDIEVIIVANPAPSPDSARVCQDYPRVTFLEVVRRGKCHALNEAIPRSRGRFIAFTDDDVVARDSAWLDKLVAHFKNDPTLGYVSGQVRAFQTTSEAQRRWEAAGGLSKGDVPRYWSKAQLANEYRLRIWPLFDVMAGANCMVPRSVLNACGFFHPAFDCGTPIPSGGTLEIGYRIIRAGFALRFDPEAIVLHQHPETMVEVKSKAYTYAMGAMAFHAYLVMFERDVRSLRYCIFDRWRALGVTLITIIRRRHPLPLHHWFFSVVGSFMGPWKVFRHFRSIAGGRKALRMTIGSLQSAESASPSQ